MTDPAANNLLFDEALTKVKSPVSPGKLDSTDKSGPLDPDFVFQIRLAAAEGGTLPEISTVYSLSGYSNELVRIVLEDGRSIMVKRSPFDWAAPRFNSARRTSALLQGKSQVVAPKYLDIPERTDGMPVLAYWHIPLPTLRELWPDLPEDQRPDLLRSLGTMLKTIHQVKVDRIGPLVDSENRCKSPADYFRNDLQNRLKPAVWGSWADAIPLLDRLEEFVAELPDGTGDAALVHNDMHMGNILCDEVDGRIRCIGLLDLEASGGGRPESDLASASVLHSPLFAEEGEDDWSEHFDEFLLEGYGEQIPSHSFDFFRAWHLLNLGFYSALNGDQWHADQVARRTRELLNFN